MGKNKLARFNENETFPLLYQPSFEEVFRKDFSLKGQWKKQVFANDAPICLELGCGKGEYTLALARKYPQRNFIGIDIKGARLWRGAKTAVEEGLPNVAFVRTRIEWIDSLFGPDEVDEIWITFPDPQLQRERRRLTHPMFLDRYRRFLRSPACIHLKTDSQELHIYTKELAESLQYPIHEAHTDIYNTGIDKQIDILEVKTFYESQYLKQGKPITYLCFEIKAMQPPV
jgi:Predicted S-adenosylmethionine-dependent methyltransferase